MTQSTDEAALANRWTTGEGPARLDDVFRRLLRGEGLDELPLAHVDGRIDLRGITAPTPERLNTFEQKGWVVQELGGLFAFNGANLEDIDFSGAQLESLRFFNSTITNCRFDHARCQDWRAWGVDVTDTSFVGTDLRDSALGPWYEGRGNTFRRVNFSGANLRSIACPAATFVDCDFDNAHLAKIEFGSTSFIRCRFAGLLRDVIFDDHGFETGKPEANPMEDVDFSDAELRMVEFRGLDLDRVKFPTSPDHIVVNHYRCVVNQAVRALRGDPKWKGLHAVMEHHLKWAGKHQEIGLFNRQDFVEMGGEAEAEFAVALLIRLENECRHQVRST